MTTRVALAIAKKEVLENVLSWRFLIALVISTLILTTSVLALGAAYREDEAAYRTRTASLERQDGSATTSELELQRVLGQPNPLGIFVRGPGDELRREEPTGGGGNVVQRVGGPGGGISTVIFGGATSSSSSAPDAGTGSASPTNQRFAPLDLAFVAVVVMSFTALIFSFDAISGERERGTLKLMLANPVPKDVILVGKYLGGMASILMPFAVSVLVALAVMQLVGVRLSGDEWTRLSLVVLLAVPLVSAFYLVGLLVSSLVKRSSTSLIAVALVWLVLVFGAGNVAAVAAKSSAGVTYDELTERFQEIDDRLASRSEAVQAEIQALNQRRAASNGTLSEADEARLTALFEEQNALATAAQNERAAVVDEARRRLDGELARAEATASVSPAEAYRGLATALARSDYWSYKDVAAAAEEYRREVDRARQEWFEDNPPFVISFPAGDGGSASGGPGDARFRSAAPAAQFEPPRFHYTPPDVGAQLSSPAAVRDLLVLAAYNVLGFVGAYLGFVRYDVR